VRDVVEHFARLTATLEDLHSVAVEGQSTDASADMQRALLALIDAELLVLGTSILAIRQHLGNG
jgi:hypothetical protein